MSQAYKICPICRTPSHPNAALCSTCGATLADVQPTSGTVRPANGKPGYDFRYGEADLQEDQLSRKPEMILTGIMVTLAVIVCVGVVAFVVPRVNDFAQSIRDQSRTGTSGGTASTPVPTRGGIAGPTLSAVTNTPRPTLDFFTVTPAPPTATDTPTQGPCIVQVASGDDLLSLMALCGHRHLDVVPVILETNDLPAPEALQAGQSLEIPWPTATGDPNAAVTAEVESDAEDDVPADDGSTPLPVEAALAASNALATETLQPGVAYHRVQPNENIIVIAFTYGADVEILSQLNPEITFSQCDFGSPSGGPNCIVNIYEGQLVRVPAPTPTPTLSPTPSGSETATPTVTPTFNAPNIVSPDHRSLFAADQLITLRWVGTGTLGRGQAYRVSVEDLTAGVVYTADTQDIFMIVPAAWQSTDGTRHEYEWSVSVIETDDPDNPTFSTEARLFSWQGRGANP